MNAHLRQVHLDCSLATLEKSLADKAMKKVWLEESSSEPLIYWKSEESAFIEQLGHLGVTLDPNILSEAQIAVRNIMTEMQKVSKFESEHGLCGGYLRDLQERLMEVAPANCSNEEYVNVLRSIVEGKSETTEFRDAVLKRLDDLSKCSGSQV